VDAVLCGIHAIFFATTEARAENYSRTSDPDAPEGSPHPMLHALAIAPGHLHLEVVSGGFSAFVSQQSSQYLDLTSFAVPWTYPAAGGTGFANSCIPGTRHFGNEGRKSLIGPHFRQFDFSIFKDTAITERVKLELRFEAYNLFNHPNFANPYLPSFIADAAKNGIGSNGRSLGAFLTATGDVGIGYPFLRSGGPRGLQIAAKISF
jgi:hypothetical protein